MGAFCRSVEGGIQGTYKRTVLRSRNLNKGRIQGHTTISPVFNGVTLIILKPLTNVPNAELRSRMYTLTWTWWLIKDHDGPMTEDLYYLSAFTPYFCVRRAEGKGGNFWGGYVSCMISSRKPAIRGCWCASGLLDTDRGPFSRPQYSFATPGQCNTLCRKREGSRGWW